MKSKERSRSRIQFVSLAGAAILACLIPLSLSAQQPQTTTSQPVRKDVSRVASTPAAYGPKSFDSPQQAAAALIKAADGFDVTALIQLFGTDGIDVVLTGEFAQDRQLAAEFTEQARAKNSVSIDPRNASRAFLLVGNDDWPFPVPIAKRGTKWSFDAMAGRQELYHRRIGANEIDAIRICHGYVEAQYEYAMKPREGYQTNQYAQRVISTPGKQDGLAWQLPDGTWAGPIGEKIARAIQQGYNLKEEPYHGYYFKILKSQGPDAPLGRMDFVVKDVMIGGFALVAAPAVYGVTGIKTFLVSHDGVVYEKDLGVSSLEEFRKMEAFNPDKTWAPVPDTDQ